MKLLRAFIEASGFDVEDVVDTKLTPISKQSGKNRITAFALTGQLNGLATVDGNKYKRGDGECYYLKPSFEIDYKVTKKKKQVNNKYLMAYSALKSQIEALMDNNCMGLESIDLRKQIELCEGFINEKD